MAVSGATSAGSGGTNIDVNGIVSKLMAVEQKPLTALNSKEASYQSKISAFGQVKSALSAFQSALHGLSSASKFQANTVTSSNPGLFTATAMGSATLGTHSVTVSNLAQSQRLATLGVQDASKPIGEGVITFDFGSVAGGEFNPNIAKPRTTQLTGAAINTTTIPAKAGATILATETTTLVPQVDSSGYIPAGALTLNGVKVAEINLLDSDSPLHRAINIADALDAAYVESGGNAGTFTADNGKVIINASSGGKSISFGVGGKAGDAATAAKNTANLAAQLGLPVAQVGMQAYDIADISVPSTVGLTVGDTISGGGFPEGTTVTEITDTTHFKTSAASTTPSQDKGLTLNVTSTSSSRSIAIDSSNNSLQGIRDAINAAKMGVTASIVNDGSSTPNRLTLSAEAVGASNNMRISVDGGDPALTNLFTHDPVGPKKLTEIAAAKDASLIIDGIPVTKTSNTVKDAIQGVTLELHNSSPAPATLEIGRDTVSVKNSVEDFVKAYNDLKKVITDLTAYNAATKKGAALQGDSAMRSLESQIDGILGNAISSSGNSLTTLSQIGVSKQTNGTLSIDSTKLNNAIDTKFNEVAGLFAAIGKSTDNFVNYKGATAITKPGNYAVTVTQLASQGGTVGSVNLNAAPVVIDSGTSINVSVDGVTAQVSLTAGSYSGEQLAAMLQDAINGTQAFSAAGKSVTASMTKDGFLGVKSNAYGTASAVSLNSDPHSASSPLPGFMGTATSTTGTNVAGSIDGAPATGLGQLLTSNTGNSTGLSIQVAGGAVGERGTVNYSEGYAHKLGNFADSALSNNGLLTGRLNGLNASVKGLSKERDTINNRLATTEERYRRQYTKLDGTLGNMNKTSAFLTQQLAKM